ncbi:Cupredoxin [Fomitopsis betulina]|nr:Cupredoxin [Fomitopsis betulina]
MLASSLTTIFIAGLFTLVRATQFEVTVGGPGVLQFNPAFVNASTGDTIVFSFRQENHTVSQSSLDNPCQLADGGFDSGFVPVASNNTDGPFQAAQYTVTDESPVWIFCRQANHCQQGMVFAVNPGDQFPTFKANALGNNTANSSTSVSATASSMNATSTSATGSASVTSSASTSANATVSVASTSTAASATTTSTNVTVVVTTTVIVSETASASTTSSSAASQSTYAEHIVVVGADGELAFEPSNITANVGDIVTFLFTHGNHSATQSSFSDPCTSLAEAGQSGFDSGFMPIANDSSTYPSFTVEVNNTDPIWVYCKQTDPKSHCAAGMVFSVNAVASGLMDYSAFVSAAEQSNTTGSSSSGSVSSFTYSRNAGVALTFLAITIGLAA